MDQTDETRRAQAQHEMALAEHAREVNRIIELGREAYGSNTFDEDSATFAEALGDKTQTAMAMLRQFDRPAEVIRDLANNPRRLAEIAKLPESRQIVEFARIEAKTAPHGRTETSRDPQWKTAPRETGRASEEEWRTNGGSRLTGDQWDRDFTRRHIERFGTKPL